MDVSRNVARTAISRSANWTAIRALNAQRQPSAASASFPSIVARRFLASTPTSRTAVEHSSSAHDPGVSTSAAGVIRSNAGTTESPHAVDDGHDDFVPIRSIFRTFDSDTPNGGGTNVPVRERLRRYERDELASSVTLGVPIIGTYNSQMPTIGMSINNGSDRFLDPEEEASLYDFTPIPAMDDLVDFGTERSFLLPGDLVELRTPAGSVELAIFIRALRRQKQFYTMSGRWMNRSSALAKFFIPHFVTAKEIEPLLAYLPHESVPDALQDRLQNFENALPRGVGGPLITKMQAFRKEADKVYRENATTLDNAYAKLAKPRKTFAASLPAITRRLLDPAHGKGIGFSVLVEQKHGAVELPSHASLYAVYRTLMNMETGVKLISKGNFRSWGQFEILAQDVKGTMDVVTNIVRLWQRQDKVHRMDSTFGHFIKKAQAAIDKSRRIRAPTIYGQVGPAQATFGGTSAVDVDVGHFDSHDMMFIRFIQCWAGWESFQDNSPLAAMGSTILRSMERYDGVMLGKSGGWLFLQEIGILKPWDIPTNYRVLVRGFRYHDSFLNKSSFTLRDRSSLNSIQIQIQKEINETTDAVWMLRHDWKDLTAYCIDDSSALEIDDAVSLERTDIEGENWVHVHVADPASIIVPGSIWATMAYNKMQSKYLPDRSEGMLDPDLVQQKLSLAPGRSTLTFSAKLNTEGELLDYKITPGTIRKVVYVTPATVDILTGDAAKQKGENVLQVGDANIETAFSETQGRHMSTPDELASHKDDLKLIMDIGSARRDHNERHGGVTFTATKFDVSTKIDKALIETETRKQSDTKHYVTDPFISIYLPPAAEQGDRDISSLMLLAGEVAAKWCKARNIPIIYRVSQKLPDADPAGFFNEHVLPYVLRGEKAPLEVLNQYSNQIGGVLPSAVPGRHVPLGIECVSRCTSPLRRYSDLLTHWQIEAALLQEAKTGKSLVGSTDLSYLPFDKKAVERMVPRQDAAETELKLMNRFANKEVAIQALLRAWKFGEGKRPLPKTFTYCVFRVKESMTNGGLVELGMGAKMSIPNWISVEGVEEGDTFEVELISVLPYNAEIHVRGLKKVEAKHDMFMVI